MPMFGNTAVIQDASGNVISGLTIKVYATQSDAAGATNLLGTAVTNTHGQWPISITGRDMVWARDPSGNVWAVASDTVAGDHASRLAALEGATATYETASHASSTYETQAAAASAFVSKGTLMYRVSDYANPQACIDAATAGSTVLFDSSVTITSALSVSKPLRLNGGSHVQCRITANGCNGINIAQGTNDVHIENLGIVASVPYTTTTNTLVGISIAGDATHSAGYHTYRSLYLSGFQTLVQSTSLQTSTFDDVTGEYCLVGIDVYGLSVNNKVTNSHIVVGAGGGVRLTGSKCIALNGQNSPTDSTAKQSEGWIITGNLLFGADINVDLFGVANCNVAGNIIDYGHVNAVRSINNGTAYSSNHDISGNYIAMAADAVTTGGAVEVANTASSGSTVRGVRVAHNDFISYGTAAPYAVHTVANAAALATVTDNTFGGFQTYDVYLQSSSNICTGNHATNVAIYNYYAAAGTSNLVANNYGNVFLDNSAGYPNVYSQVGNNKWMSGAAAPTSLTWGKGDRVINSSPAVGSPKAWTCTVAGTPGTWVSEGNL